MRALGLIIWITITPIASAACSCVTSGLGREFEQSDAVFVAEVVAVEYFSRLGQLADELAKSHSIGGPSVALVRPSEVFRDHWSLGTDDGAARRPVYILSGASNCDVPFQAGERYLVFAKGVTSGIFHTSICAGTATVPRALETLRRLRVLKKAYDEIGER